jgi:magnesium and cobalt transporter
MPQENTQPHNWLSKLMHSLRREPKDEQELIELLQKAQDNQVMDADAFSSMRSILTFSKLIVSDVMLPRGQMVCIDGGVMISDVLPTIIASGHSRFPILNQDHDGVVGVLLAKDVLPLVYNGTDSTTSVKSIARKATFVPETKHLDALLHEFRTNRAHMAIVVDEYGSLAGLITIEDILEEIVGDIIDETDLEEKPQITPQKDGSFTLNALTPIEDFNAYFNTQWPDDTQDTIAGLLCEQSGALPNLNDTLERDHFSFTILDRDERRLILLKVTQLNDHN